MRVLIIGAAGYVGRFLAWRMENAHELVLSDVVEPDDTRIPWVYEALKVQRTPEFTPKPSAKLPFTKGDMMDFEYCKAITKGMDAVLNLSAVIDFENVTKCFAVNAVGTFNVLEACAQNEVKRVLVASSINACGLFHCRVTNRPRDFVYLPVDEDIPVDHEDAYSLSKYCNELNCRAWTNRTGMTTAAFRFSGVFPPEWTDTFKTKVKPTTEWPDTLAEYVDLRDVARGLQQALECESLPRSGVYQLSAPDTQLPEPTMEIIKKFKPEWMDRIKKPLPGRTSFLSHEHAKKAFGFEPQHHWGDLG